MAEPVTLYKDGKTVTTAAPSEARRLQGEGWSLDAPAPKAEPAPKSEPKSARK